MNLKSPSHLVIFLKMSIHSFGIKTNEYSNDNDGFKNPVEIAIEKY